MVRKTRKTLKAPKYWGYHLIINAGGCDYSKISCKETISKFAKKLVRDIDMVAYGEPRIVKFGAGHTQGYTLVQLIETSSITAHFVEETNDVYLDIFSCKPFDPKIAARIFKDAFSPKKVDMMFLKRQAPAV